MKSSYRLHIVPYTMLASPQQTLELLSFLKVFPAWNRIYFVILEIIPIPSIWGIVENSEGVVHLKDQTF